MVKRYKRVLYALFSVLGVATLLFSMLFPNIALAGQITGRSLQLVGPTPPSITGGSEAGAVANHSFTFTVPSTAAIGSIEFLYCTTADNVGNPPNPATQCPATPTGLDTTAATIGTVSGSGATDLSSINTTNNGAPYIYTTGTPTSISGGTQIVVTLDGITNPTTANQTFFVRIFTFTSINATGTPTDSGNVAASTANQITLNGQMPESLVFCVGGTVGTTNGVADCTKATSGNVYFNQLFSPTAAATATSQMAASTNAGSGYAINVYGPTLASGTNTITALTTASTSKNGISQFGMNLVANTTLTSNPAVGASVTPASDGVNYNAAPQPGWNTADTFKFDDTTANLVANSGGLSSNAQIYTASYIVNVPGNQPAGTYTTTLTYVCTPTF